MAEAKRKATTEKRKEMVQYYIYHNRNYKNTDDKFDVYYSQIYSWVKKYNLNEDNTNQMMKWMNLGEKICI